MTTPSTTALSGTAAVAARQADADFGLGGGHGEWLEAAADEPEQPGPQPAAPFDPTFFDIDAACHPHASTKTTAAKSGADTASAGEVGTP